MFSQTSPPSIENLGEQIWSHLVDCSISSPPHPLDGHTLVYLDKNTSIWLYLRFKVSAPCCHYQLKSTSALDTSVSVSTLETSVIFFRSLHIVINIETQSCELNIATISIEVIGYIGYLKRTRVILPTPGTSVMPEMSFLSNTWL